ncbi:hypothetical protein LTR37_015037 [Vermiconidia calcicola]|uniref:Uncharacterized protein n=1 Tax=Vermiconidia calcicola TaxID=1690605 RepID=A0ACC3MSJ9_9PEZI|nr:hypothetical protein LTR37_015037 [Vermiconidia calcicola]
MSTKTIAGITVPDTPVVTAAQALARDHMDDWSYNHVVRSWLLGFAIAEQMPPFAERDQELHAVAAILHDLGWVEKDMFMSSDKCFEVDGANAAKAFVERQPNLAEWDQHRKQLLWDAIALHTHLPVAMHKQPEVSATCFGILADFVGPAGIPGGTLSDSAWKTIIHDFPRQGFKSGVIETMCGLCKNKPETTYNTFVSEFGDEMVDGYTSKGQRVFDIIQNTIDAD